MEDWALIRRLDADGVPRRQVARQLGIGRSTVDRALESDRPPRYERKAAQTSFTPFEARVRAFLGEHPEMLATVIAERAGWSGSITWFRDNVRALRPDYRRIHDELAGLGITVAVDGLADSQSAGIDPAPP